MRALLDTNVVLDHLLAREPFADDAKAIWLALDQGRFEGFVAAITPVNVYYVTRKLSRASEAVQFVKSLLSICHVCTLDHTILQSALLLPFGDFEDAVQVAGAVAEGLDAIVTRDARDFAGSPLPVFTPAEFRIELSRQPDA
jgi:predicted nucleic acid-binding protein